jgi:putative hydrolase of the HAD superfamily
MILTKIISGGQTGADRAALDFAIKHNIPHGGWIPKGRLTEAGRLPDRYQLRETPRQSYAERTERNIIDSDGTLIVSHGKLTGGSLLTRQYAKRQRRPWLHIDLDRDNSLPGAAAVVSRWLDAHAIKVLNVAGPRASKDPAIYRSVMRLLQKTLYGTSRIEAVLFDFGGVIAEEGWKKGLTCIAKANRLDAAAFLKTASDVIYETGHILGKCTANPFWATLRKRTGIREDNATLIHEVISRFIPRTWMIDLVKRLKAAGLTVGILSDQTEMLDVLNTRFDFFKWFDRVFNSYHIGKGKRDATLFDDIAGYLKIPPERILFIDDDPGHVDRARQRGWHAILYVERATFEKEMRKYLP